MGTHYKIPASKYCKLPLEDSPSEDKDEHILSWQRKFTRDIAQLIRDGTNHRFQASIGHWEYRRPIDDMSCTVKVSRTSGSKGCAVYEFFPYVNRAEVVSPNPKSPARLAADPLFESRGYTVLEQYEISRVA
jgi:hypothetical protein